MKHEQWEQAGSTILSRGEAWVCIMAEPHHSQPRLIDIASPDWDEAMKRAKMIKSVPALLAALVGAEQTLRNLAHGFLDAEANTIANNEAANIRAAIAKATGE